MATGDSKGKISALTIFATIGGVVVGIVLGIAFSKISQNSSSTLNEKNAATVNQIDEAILQDQSAFVAAKVKNVSPTSVSVENSSGKQATFTLNEKVFYTKQGSDPKTQSVTGSVNDIEVDDFVIINLKRSNGDYQVYSIVIPPPLGTPPPPPPLSSTSPTPQLSPKPSASGN